jgi:hypothetical protein
MPPIADGDVIVIEGYDVARLGSALLATWILAA